MRKLIVAIVFLLPFFLHAQAFAVIQDSSDASKRRDAFLVSLQNKPADLLISLAHQAQGESRFSDAVLILETALQAPYGETVFKRTWSGVVREVATQMNSDLRDKIKPWQPLDPKGEILEIFTTAPVKDNATGISRSVVQVHFYTRLSVDKTFADSATLSAASRIQAAMKKAIPDLSLDLIQERSAYALRGFFNSEQPNIIPQAQFELGMLYFKMLDYLMAERMLSKTISYHISKSAREIAELGPSERPKAPEYVFQALYTRAQIWYMRATNADYQRYQSDLELLCSFDPDWVHANTMDGYTPVPTARSVEFIKRTFDRNGFNELLTIYTFKDDFSRDAHRLLGIRFLVMRNFEEAIPHLLFACLKPLSKIIDEIRSRNYGYEFSNLTQLFHDVQKWDDLKNYLIEANVYESLDILAQAEYADTKNPTLLKPIWQALAQSPDAGQYRDDAVAMLKKLK